MLIELTEWKKFKGKDNTIWEIQKFVQINLRFQVFLEYKIRLKMEQQ